MENPFYRKCLIRSKEEVNYLDEEKFKISNFPVADRSVDEPGNRITYQSLKFIPTSSGRIDIVDSEDRGETLKNRLGG